jgi:hypothetical protein
MYTYNELLFPHQAIASLHSLRGQEWQQLVERVSSLPETHEETLAFMMMMIRLNGCMSCETDSYRAMRGCIGCAVQTLRRYKGPDSELIELFQQALHDIQQYAEHNPTSRILREAYRIDTDDFPLHLKERLQQPS